MDDLIGFLVKLIFFGVVIGIVVYVLIFAFSVAVLTALTLVGPALIITFGVIRHSRSVDHPQAIYRMRALNFHYYALLLLPGVYCYLTISDPTTRGGLIILNVCTWSLGLAYGVHLAFFAGKKRSHYKRLPDYARRHRRADGSIDVRAVARDSPLGVLAFAPPSWQSENYERRARQAARTVKPEAGSTPASKPPLYPNADVRDLRAATEAVGAYGDYVRLVGEQEARRAYDEAMKRADTTNRGGVK